jgi:ELWxxDGT repeat protein
LAADGAWRVAATGAGGGDAQVLGAIHGPAGLERAALGRAGSRVLVAGRRLGAEEDVLWATQGTAATSETLRRFGSGDLDESTLVELRNRTVFIARDAAGREPWVTDGTARGTKRLLDACPGTCSSDPEVVGAWGNRAVLRVRDGAGRVSILMSDGTTTVATGIACKTGCDGVQLVVLDDGDRALLLVDRPTAKVEVWSTAGRAGDLKRLRELPLESLPSAGWAFLAARDALIFAGADAAGSPDLVPFALSLATGARIRLGDARP